MRVKSRRKANPAPTVSVGELRPFDIPTEPRPVLPRREPRPHFPHLVKPRPGCFVVPPVGG